VNIKLSEQRAKAVCDYLISKSIDPGRMTHKGLGSSLPLSPNDTEEGRKQNRRVEFKFMK
jgi:outer membrane protein OmpA-like peptidoglycan-associated protein